MTNSGLTLKLFADASYGIRVDGKSQTRIEIAICNDPLFVKGAKQHFLHPFST